jgi:tetratricopeptide (TPR) repeat protein
MKFLFCLSVTFIVFSAVAQSGGDWAAYKRANGIDAHWTYNAWVAAGCPRGSGGGSSQPQLSPEQIAAQQAAIAAQQQKEADAQAANNDGLKACKNEDWDTAADDFQKALQILPNNQVYLKNLAQTQARLGEKARGKNDYATSIDYYQKALANDPNDQDIRESLDTAKYLLQSSEEGKTASDNMRQSIQKVAQNVNTTTAAGGLDFDGDNSGNLPKSGILDSNSSLKGVPADGGTNMDGADDLEASLNMATTNSGTGLKGFVFTAAHSNTKGPIKGEMDK